MKLQLHRLFSVTTCLKESQLKRILSLGFKSNAHLYNIKYLCLCSCGFSVATWTNYTITISRFCLTLSCSILIGPCKSMTSSFLNTASPTSKQWEEHFFLMSKKEYNGTASAVLTAADNSLYLKAFKDKSQSIYNSQMYINIYTLWIYFSNVQKNL